MESTKNNSKKTTKTTTKKTTSKTNKNETKKVTKQPTKTNNTKTTTKNTKKDNKLPIILIAVAIILIIIICLLNRNNNNWTQDGNIVSKGNESYEIGDYYEYDESNNGKITGLTDVKWKVLGVDDNGNLLIVSASSIGDLTLGHESDIEIAKKDYLEGNKKINDFTKNYGNGKGAISVRSFTNSDLIKLGNYPNTSNQEEYTYYWTDEENPISVNKNSEKSRVKLPYNNNFIYYNEDTKTWVNVEKSGTETTDNPVKITSQENKLLAISNQDYTTKEYYIEPDSKVFNMIYLNDAGERETFWTDNSFVSSSQSFIAYGYNVVLYDGLNYRYLVYSSLNTRENTAGIRAVVTID